MERNERIQKILSRAGVASRRAAEELIREGRVRLNGKIVRDLGTRADPANDKITVDGRAAMPARLHYMAYHKPVGVVSTMSDPQGRPSIGDVVRGTRRHLFPVGRLDYESSGLVLLTNDGDLAQRLMHPRYGIPKVYRVKVRGHPDEKALRRLSRGVKLEDGMTQAAEVVVEAELERKTRLRVTIREGRQRQIRRMCEAIGHPVDRLSRVSIGPLRLGRLAGGQGRDLTRAELEALLRAVRRRGAAPRSIVEVVKAKSASPRRKPSAKSRTARRKRA